VNQWVRQLLEEDGLLDGASSSPPPASKPSAVLEALTDASSLMDQTLETELPNTAAPPQENNGFRSYTNPVTGVTMHVSADGRKAYYTTSSS
jgi:hypothetical protein